MAASKKVLSFRKILFRCLSRICLLQNLTNIYGKKVAEFYVIILIKGYTAVPISVNVSRMDIYSLDLSKIFVNLTRNTILRRYLEIEITESAFTSDEEQILKAVDELRELGFIVLMDDFGSGYSSLNMLKDISVDVLKIDTRFLEAGRDGNTKGKEILESVIKMAKMIGLSIIAEGVETDEQKNFLLDRGCNYAQVFIFQER